MLDAIGHDEKGRLVDTDYVSLARQVEQLCAQDVFWAGALANVAAQVMETLPDLNWAGFYLREGLGTDEGLGNTLVLGPFQGRVACTRIPWGKGVCGTAVTRDECVLVADVHAFSGHIACDSASRSECVVPLHVDAVVVGVLDLDAPTLARFTDADARGLADVASALERSGVLTRALVAKRIPARP